METIGEQTVWNAEAFRIDDRIDFDLKLETGGGKLSGSLPPATIHPALNRVSPVKDHEIFIEESFAGQISHNYQYRPNAEPLPLFPEWPLDQLNYAEYPVLYPNTCLDFRRIILCDGDLL